jgi:hypothetical protein
MPISSATASPPLATQPDRLSRFRGLESLRSRAANASSINLTLEHEDSMYGFCHLVNAIVLVYELVDLLKVLIESAHIDRCGFCHFARAIQ